MKRKGIFFLITLMLVAGMLYYSNSVHLEGWEGIITYSYGELQFTQSLSPEELREVKRIINGKLEYPDYPACVFSEKRAIVIDGIPFALACDGCELVKNCQSGKYLSLSASEHSFMEELFRIRGGIFPCV